MDAAGSPARDRELGSLVKAIVAFANTAGGTLLIGVEDRSRHVRGVPDALDLEERLANLVSDRIGPRIVPVRMAPRGTPGTRMMSEVTPEIG